MAFVALRCATPWLQTRPLAYLWHGSHHEHPETPSPQSHSVDLPSLPPASTTAPAFWASKSFDTSVQSLQATRKLKMKVRNTCWRLVPCCHSIQGAIQLAVWQQAIGFIPASNVARVSVAGCETSTLRQIRCGFGLHSKWLLWRFCRAMPSPSKAK